MEQTNNLGNKIRQARKKKNLSQKDLARICGITETQICRLEKGEHKPQFKTLVRIAECLKLELRELTEGLGYNKKVILDKQLVALNPDDAELIEELINKIAIISEKEKAIIRLILNQKCPP